MPMQRSLYPDNWADIATQIKAAAGWRCQECSRLCRMPGEEVGAFLERIRTGRISECPIVAEFIEKPGRFVLTVAHLDHQPENCDPANLRALCAPCHCRYDLAAMATKKRLKAERAGQMRLEGM